jgi:zinc transport system substrate-binding protein
MKKFLLLLLLVFTLIACDDSKEADIVTTMYVQYDIAKVIVKEKLSVSILIAPGAEVHGYDPSTRDIDAIMKSKLFIFTSPEIDDWIKDPEKLAGKDTLVMDLSTSFNHIDDHLHTNVEEEQSEQDHEHSELHYWTDPIIFMELIKSILDKIIEIDPVNSDYYRENANNYYKEVDELHHSLEDYLISSQSSKTIYFAGHNAMAAFEKRYNLEIIALSNTTNPDADPTGKQIATLITKIETANAHYLFIEELKEPRIANTIKSELARKDFSLELLLLHGYHNVSKDDLENRVRYADLLEQNIKNIKIALGND